MEFAFGIFGEGLGNWGNSKNGYLNKYDTTIENEHGVVIEYDDFAHEYVESKLITYKIDINPYGNKLNGDDGKLTLTDYIDTNMDLNTDSVKL